MPRVNFNILTTEEIIAPVPTKLIRIVGFWYELAHDWADGDIFAFVPTSDEGYTNKDFLFPKTMSGVAAMNLTGINKYVTLGIDRGLTGYISGGGKTVRGTVIFELI